MGIAHWIVLLFTHPLEFRTLLQFYVYHEQQRDIKALKEHPTSGWDRASMRTCWKFLDLTSRSFSAVIKELEGDLARTVSDLPRFYFPLRVHVINNAALLLLQVLQRFPACSSFIIVDLPFLSCPTGARHNRR